MRFLSALMGVNFRPANVRELVKDTDAFEQFPLRLEREPDNPYDSNAIRVLAETGSATLGDGDEWEFVGFVQKDIAEELAPLLDLGYEASVKVIGWLATNKPHLEIEASLPETEQGDAA